MKSNKPTHRPTHWTGFLSSALTVMMLGGLVNTVRADDPIPVRFLSYTNCGSYTVKKVKLNWKAEGEKHSETVATTLEGDYKVLSGASKNNSTCVDLTKESYGIPEGAEVWLSYDIESGDSKSCRKDTPRVFAAKGMFTQESKSKGQTLTNNRCFNRFYGKLSEAKYCKIASTDSC